MVECDGGGEAEAVTCGRHFAEAASGVSCDVITSCIPKSCIYSDNG